MTASARHAWGAPAGGSRRGGAGGLAAVKPAALFDYVAGLLILIYVWRFQDVVPMVGKLQVPMIGTLLALAIFLASGHYKVTIPLLRAPTIKAALFIVIWMAVSIPQSLYRGQSFGFVFNDHIKTLLMMFILMSSVRTTLDVERLALASLIGGAMYCTKILTSYSVGENGRLNAVLFYDANDLAMMAVVTFPITVYFMRPGAKVWQRLFAVLCAGVFVLTVVRAGSRGGFLGFVGVAAFMLVGFRAIPKRTRLMAMTLMTVLLFALAGPKFWDMMGTVLKPQEDYNTNLEAGRLMVWQRGMGYMASRPITGVGVAAFGVAEGKISEMAERGKGGVKWSAAHNSFVQIGAELGLPGFVAFLLLLYHLARVCWRVSRSKLVERPTTPRERALADAFLACLVGYVIPGFFLSQAYSAYLYVFCGLITSLGALTGATHSKAIRGGAKSAAGGTRFRTV